MTLKATGVHWVTVTGGASGSTVKVIEILLTTVTLEANHIFPARTLPRLRMTRSFICTNLVTVTSCQSKYTWLHIYIHFLPTEDLQCMLIFFFFFTYMINVPMGHIPAIIILYFHTDLSNIEMPHPQFKISTLNERSKQIYNALRNLQLYCTVSHFLLTWYLPLEKASLITAN